ncbi:hypothetical protein RFI_12304, partial [Reticulomyxa filosa]
MIMLLKNVLSQFQEAIMQNIGFLVTGAVGMVIGALLCWLFSTERILASPKKSKNSPTRVKPRTRNKSTTGPANVPKEEAEIKEERKASDEKEEDKKKEKVTPAKIQQIRSSWKSMLVHKLQLGCAIYNYISKNQPLPIMLLFLHRNTNLDKQSAAFMDMLDIV